MNVRRAPAIATCFLKLFCSRPEHESVVGDLMEQYQQGKGRLWYWRQSLHIVRLALYSKVMRRPLTADHRISAGTAFTSILLIATLVMLMLSPIWPLFLVVIVPGVYIGIMKYTRGARRTETTQSYAGPQTVRIDSSKISIGGGWSAGALILFLLASVLHDLPPLRFLVAPGLVAGVIFGAVLHRWRELHPRSIEKDWLSIKAK